MENAAETTEERLNRLEQRLNATVDTLRELGKMTELVVESLKITEGTLRNLIRMSRYP